MKIIKKGNVYKKSSWMKENEGDLLIIGCIVVGFLCFVLFCFIRG